MKNQGRIRRGRAVTRRRLLLARLRDLKELNAKHPEAEDVRVALEYVRRELGMDPAVPVGWRDRNEAGYQPDIDAVCVKGVTTARRGTID